MKHLNIVQIISHDMGRHLGCYDAAVTTPNFDRIAARGVRFENYFCPSSICSPSRGSLMTGLYPLRHGLIGLAHLGWGYNPGVRNLVQYLAGHGYQTHLIGGHHEAPADLSQAVSRREAAQALGYQYFYDTCPRLIADPPWNYIGACYELLQENLDTIADAGGPFYLNIGTPGAHRPFRDLRGMNRYADDGRPGVAFLPDSPSSVVVPPYLRDCEGVRSDLGYLNAFVRREDEYVGRIFDLLVEKQMLENTLLVLTTDHGVAMPRAKGMCYDPGLGTYLIICLPGAAEQGALRSELLSNVDFTPTLLAAAGFEAPEDLDGRSFLPLLTGREYVPRDHIFAEMNWADHANPIRALRTRRYKYIRNFGLLPKVSITLDAYAGRAGEAMHHDCYYHTRLEEELYDLEQDPWEQNNLVGHGAYKELRQDLSDRLTTWMCQRNDFLPDGSLPSNPVQEQSLRSPYRCG